MPACGLFAGLGFLLFCAATASAQNTQPEVKIQNGIVRGSAADGVRNFRGIPFAAAPVGSLRWKAPQPATWSGVRDATKFGADCMQLPFKSFFLTSPAGLSEDCLYLNVWAPPEGTGKKLPVVVWIHGGGFVDGGSSASITDGGNFAAHGVVLVSFNYRLGRPGFFAFPALSREGSGRPLNNYGLMDQIAALRWVQRNIHAFGGDARHVTIMGESAGGASVLALLNSPVAKGLFRRVIVQSGGGRDSLAGVRYLDRPSATETVSAEDTGIAFARRVGIMGTDDAALAALRALPAQKLVDGLEMDTLMASRGTWSGLIVDGVIQKQPLEESILSKRLRKIPIMIGANSAAAGIPRWHSREELLSILGRDKRRAAYLYDAAHSSNRAELASRVVGDLMVVEPARFVARAMSAAGVTTYEYRFSYVAQADRGVHGGASQASEIPYIFSTLKAAYADRNTLADEAMAAQLSAYWINFIKTGNPNSAALPAWPTYRAKTDHLMNFNNTGPVDEIDAWKERLDLMDKLATRADAMAHQSAPTNGDNDR